MAQTHQDSDSPTADQFMASLESKAARMVRDGKSLIASGDDAIREWQANNVHCAELPVDEHGILRISLGGGSDTPIELNYCRFRGDHGKCVGLLRKVLLAMERGEDD